MRMRLLTSRKERSGNQKNLRGRSQTQSQSISLEQGERLSRSSIWDRQRTYFERQNISAWSTGSVPHHITNSPFIAAAYAKVIFAFLSDCHRPRRHAKRPNAVAVDSRRPVYIVE